MPLEKYPNKLDLYAKEWVKNEAGEREKVYAYQKTLYCRIKPTTSGTNSIANTDVQEGYSLLNINVRKLSIKTPEKDMYFKDKYGMVYEIVEFFPVYKDNSEWQFRCRTTRES